MKNKNNFDSFITSIIQEFYNKSEMIQIEKRKVQNIVSMVPHKKFNNSFALSVFQIDAKDQNVMRRLKDADYIVLYRPQQGSAIVAVFDEQYSKQNMKLFINQTGSWIPYN